MGNRQFDRQTIIDAMTNKSVHIIQSSNIVTALNAGILERHIFFSPKGTISRIINAQVTWAKETQGGITGSKSIIFDNYISDTSGLGNFRGDSTDVYNDFVFDQGTFKNGYNVDTTKLSWYPNDLSGINNILRGLTFDETVGLSIVFSHTMNWSATSARNILLFVEQEVVSR